MSQTNRYMNKWVWIDEKQIDEGIHTASAKTRPWLLYDFVNDLRGTEPRFSLKESTLWPDSNSAGLQEMRTRNHHKPTGKNASWSSLWVCSFGGRFHFGEKAIPEECATFQPAGWKPTKLPFLAVVLLVQQLWAKSLVQSFRRIWCMSTWWCG